MNYEKRKKGLIIKNVNSSISFKKTALLGKQESDDIISREDNLIIFLIFKP